MTEKTKMEYEFVVVKISKSFLKCMLSYLNTHPDDYEDFNEYVIEALRNHNLNLRSNCPERRIMA